MLLTSCLEDNTFFFLSISIWTASSSVTYIKDKAKTKGRVMMCECYALNQVNLIKLPLIHGSPCLFSNMG